MATKKKAKKKSPKPKKSARKKSKPVKRLKKSAQQRVSSNTASKKKTAGKKRARKRTARSSVAEFSQKSPGSFSGDQSGDLQGLSRSETANSESVDELLEEGNAFEADAVSGVEDAENDDPREVRTHEVPEDDVPEEYLDKD